MSSLSEPVVRVPFSQGGGATDTAVLLLAAAEELALPGTIIKTQGGAFLVPATVERQAFGPRATPDVPVTRAAAKKSTTAKQAQE